MDAVSYKFPKNSRLSSLTSVNEVFLKGRILRVRGFKVFLLQNMSECNRIMIAVPKKIHRKAVTRNLIKRRIREAYRINTGILNQGKGNCADIILIYNSDEIPEFAGLKNTVCNVLKKIRGLIDADTLPAVPVAD
ncbi:MAG: ribonuclease P protein component [Bacteroidales bacterium]|nr:ribonuclease P protein component [Bacteroidales bacterium]MDD2425728.1 ribonuclease P protein component [Bacteroidales bacterium]MDD3989628.1 ribonuclease P protein component [Bacteroidales bacterium]MDD4638681.1 ribonuclease P protein component [Bacteroidales bacterium]